MIKKNKKQDIEKHVIENAKKQFAGRKAGFNKRVGMCEWVILRKRKNPSAKYKFDEDEAGYNEYTQRCPRKGSELRLLAEHKIKLCHNHAEEFDSILTWALHDIYIEKEIVKGEKLNNE